MNATDIINEAAANHRIDAAELTVFLTAGGWDFSPFTGNTAEVAFVSKMVDHYASQIAARRDRIEWANAQIVELREKRLTKAARANPEAQCGKCDGTGRILAFSHVAGGSCFQCQGTGVLRCAA